MSEVHRELAARTDFRRAVRLLRQAREHTLAGHQPDIEHLAAIVRSHRRLAQQGLDPARGANVRALSIAQLERRRHESELAGLIPALRKAFERADHSQVTTVHDPDGWVLWRFGTARALRNADSLGLSEGACWREDAVGTTAAGTASVIRGGLLCIAREHYVASHHPFACAATPLFDAWDRRLLGVLNATTLAEMTHPNTLSMVELAARLAEELARKAADHKLRTLREAAGPTLFRLGTPAVLTDHRGRVAMSHRVALKRQVLTPPTQVPNQPFEYSPLGGWWVMERFSTGLLWRPASAEPAPLTRVELDVHQPSQWSLTVHGVGTSTRYNVTKRHVEVLFLLTCTPAGSNTAELAQDLYGGFTAKSTVRSLFSRIQKEFGRDLFDSEPYRFKDHLDVRVHKPDNPAELLPFSTAPAICRIRAGTVS